MPNERMIYSKHSPVTDSSFSKIPEKLEALLEDYASDRELNRMKIWAIMEWKSDELNMHDWKILRTATVL